MVADKKKYEIKAFVYDRRCKRKKELSEQSEKI